MATAFSEVLAPGELSVPYTTTHAPLRGTEPVRVRRRHGVIGRRKTPREELALVLSILSCCQVKSSPVHT